MTKTRNFSFVNDIKIMKYKPYAGKKFPKLMSDKGLVFKIYIYLLTLNNKKTNIPIKGGKNTWTDTLPEKIHRWQISMLQDAQHHVSLGNCILKGQGDITAYLLGSLNGNPWPPNVGKDVEHQELLCIAGRNAKRNSLYGRQLGNF